jgi:hypothetical protein
VIIGKHHQTLERDTSSSSVPELQLVT